VRALNLGQIRGPLPKTRKSIRGHQYCSRGRKNMSYHLKEASSMPLLVPLKVHLHSYPPFRHRDHRAGHHAWRRYRLHTMRQDERPLKLLKLPDVSARRSRESAVSTERPTLDPRRTCRLWRPQRSWSCHAGIRGTVVGHERRTCPPTEDTAGIELVGPAERATTSEPEALETCADDEAGGWLYAAPQNDVAGASAGRGAATRRHGCRRARAHVPGTATAT
jgi:hypothetical protein